MRFGSLANQGVPFINCLFHDVRACMHNISFIDPLQKLQDDKKKSRQTHPT
jgi:hypothetical protein